MLSLSMFRVDGGALLEIKDGEKNSSLGEMTRNTVTLEEVRLL